MPVRSHFGSRACSAKTLHCDSTALSAIMAAMKSVNRKPIKPVQKPTAMKKPMTPVQKPVQKTMLTKPVQKPKAMKKKQQRTALVTLVNNHQDHLDSLDDRMWQVERDVTWLMEQSDQSSVSNVSVRPSPKDVD